MPIRFEAYRVRDGVTPLSEDFFNGVFGDVDARIAELEERRADWQAVVDELTAFGLQRIDTLVGPSMAGVTAMLADLRQRRDELVAAIGNVGDLASKTELDALADALDAVQDSVQTVAGAVAAINAGKVSSVNGVGGQDIILHPVHLGLGPANGPASTALVRDGQGRLSTVTQSVAGKPAVKTLTYDGQGRLSSVVTTYDGLRRTETLTYGASGLESVAAVEVAI